MIVKEATFVTSAADRRGLLHPDKPMIAATKSDKLAKTRVREAVRRVAAGFRTGEGNVIAVSSETRFGKEAVLGLLERVCALHEEGEETEEEKEADAK